MAAAAWPECAVLVGGRCEVWQVGPADELFVRVIRNMVVQVLDTGLNLQCPPGFFDAYVHILMNVRSCVLSCYALDKDARLEWCRLGGSSVDSVGLIFSNAPSGEACEEAIQDWPGCINSRTVERIHNGEEQLCAPSSRSAPLWSACVCIGLRIRPRRACKQSY